MRAWTYEADQINIGDIDVENVSQDLVTNYEIERFLQFSRDDNKLFIVAPKGLGKTLLLKAKSQLYRSQASGYAFIPESELVERFTPNHFTFAKKELERFATLEAWEKVWELALHLMLLRRFEISVSREFENVLGGARSLPDILAALLNSRSALDKLSRRVATELRPAVRDISRLAGLTQIAVFIDNIDEGFLNHTGSALKESLNGSGGLSEQVWINAQIGSIIAARAICVVNKHIKIFLSSRTEALNNYQGPFRLQLDDYITYLTYSKSQIRSIVERNIEDTDSKDLVLPHAKDHMERFLGFSKLPHRFALDLHGNPREEDAFDYIYRHTFGRPRELVRIGSELVKIPRQERTPRKISDTVNEWSNRILNQYKEEIIPYFDESIFEEAVSQFQSNVIEQQQALEINRYFESKYGCDNLLAYYSEIGLLGKVVKSDFTTEDREQRFKPVGQYRVLSPEKMPLLPEYFVTHPSLDEDLNRSFGTRFYSLDNVIGQDYPFFLPRIRKPKALHVHFGLSRDSLSLVLPELSRAKQLAVVQRPGREHHLLTEVEDMVLQTSNNDYVSFKVIKEDDEGSVINERLKAWESHQSHILIYSSNRELVSKVLSLCETITALNHDELLDSALNSQNARSEPAILYFCQRYIKPQTFSRLRKRLRDTGTKWIKVIPTLIDRLSFNIHQPHLVNGVLVYEVDAEKRGAIICRDRTLATIRPNKVVIRTSSDREQRYYEKRQKYIVEGIYRLLKIITRDFKGAHSSETLDDMFSMFYTIQVDRLLRETPEDTVRVIFNLVSESERHDKLIRFCADTRKRFESLNMKFGFSGPSGFASKSRQEKIFPSDSDFYRHMNFSTNRNNAFLNTVAMLALREILDVKDRRDLRSVFVSYSYKDNAFAERIYDALKKRGIRAFLMQKDDPNRSFETIMVEEIKKHERILFIASENSVKSDACHFELTEGRKKYSVTWEQVFVPIRLDDFIINVREHELGTHEKRHEYWTNIQALRAINIIDFSDFLDADSLQEFEENVDAWVQRSALHKA